MFLLYELLQENRDALITTLLHRIPREVRLYSRAPRTQLRSSLEYIYDAVLHRIASGSDDDLNMILNYVARLRHGQSFQLATVIKAMMCVMPVVRNMLQRACRELESADAHRQFNQAMTLIEQIHANAVVKMAQYFQEQVDARNEEKRAYIDDPEKLLPADLSRMIIFRG